MPAPLRFRVLAHPTESRVGSTIDVPPDEETVEVGRSSICGIELIAPSISRRHAALRRDGDEWFVLDLGSRHGTFLNGARIAGGESTPLRPGDELQIGPVLLSVNIDGQGSRAPMMTIAEVPGTSGSVASVVPHSALGGLAQRRLDVLMRSAATLAAAPDVESLAGTVAIAAGRGTRAVRAFVLRPTGETADFELIGSYRARGAAASPTEEISHSVVAMARSGKLAQLTTDQSLPVGVAAPSIVGLGIRSAICAPIQVDEGVAALLYVDARGAERELESDAAGFCEALAAFAGLAMANLRRVEVEQRQAELRRDLDAARSAQRQIMPPPEGTIGPVHYSSISMPGRVVAGDLFDVIPLDDHRAVVMLGDVSGKGVGAAVMMATVQTYVRASAGHSADPSELLADVNRYVCGRFSVGRFVTLWLGIVDAAAGTLRYADAGHGHWCILVPGAAPITSEEAGGYPIGVEASSDYPAHEIPFPSGARVVLFSDGLVEQTNEDGRQFGRAGVLDVVRTSGSCADDVTALHEALETHAAGGVFDDDLTIASVGLQ